MPACSATGTKRSSHHRLVEDFDVVSADDAGRSVEEFERFSGRGHSQGWRFNREEIHQRK
jgi:hypothetical protein